MRSQLLAVARSLDPFQSYASEASMPLRSFRLSCAALVLFVPTFGWIYHGTSAAPVDPMAVRYALALLGGIALAATYASERLRRLACPLHQSVIYGLIPVASYPSAVTASTR